MSNQLIPVESVNAIELFKNNDTLTAFLDEIRAQAMDFDPDVNTVEGRSQIAAQAYKVSKSKTVIDAAGKELTLEWARQKKVVDQGRRTAREYCDMLRDEIRKPLTEYEEEEKRIEHEAIKKAQFDAAETDAYAEHDIWLREIAIKEKEEKLAAEQDERNRVEAERIAGEERAEREMREAIDLQHAKAKSDADLKERERLKLIEENEREAQRRAADIGNRRTVNNSIVDALVAGGISKESAKAVVKLIANGHIPSISIRY